MRISPADLRQRLLPIVLAQATGLACGIAGVKLTSRLVAPEDYGTYGIFVSLASVGAGVIYAGMVKYVSRHWQDAPDRPALARAILAGTLRKTPWLLGAVVAATLLAAPGQKFAYGTLLFASALFLTLLQLAQSALQAARENWRDCGISAGVSVARSFGPPLLYAATGAGRLALLAGFALQALLGALLGGWNMRRWRPRAAGPAPARAIDPFYEGPRLVTLALAAWVLAGLNRWLVAWFFGAEVAGHFTLASNIGAIVPTMLGMVIMQYAQPHWFAADIGSREARLRLFRDVDRVALAYTAGAVALLVLLQLAMPRLIGVLVDERYAFATHFVLVTGCSTTALTIGMYYHTLLFAAKRERACTLTDLSGAAGTIAGGLVTAAAGLAWFRGWLILSLLVPWLVNRTLARRAVLAPG